MAFHACKLAKWNNIRPGDITLSEPDVVNC